MHATHRTLQPARLAPGDPLAGRPTLMLTAALALAVALAVAAPTFAGSVSIRPSQQETYIDLPVQVIIEINYTTGFDPPDVPSIDGATVSDLRSIDRARHVTIINGRRSERRSESLAFRVTPTRAGTLRIPAIPVTVDDQLHTTRPLVIRVLEPNADDRLRAAVEVPRDRIYLGEPLIRTLRVRIRPYHDVERDMMLGSSDMWSLIDHQDSVWGPFREAVQTLLAQRRAPPSTVVTDDEQQRVYEYTLTATDYPAQTGPVDSDPVHIVLHYPLALRERRLMFGRPELTVAESLPIMASTSSPPVRVLDPPRDGQPDIFNGAVGRFTIRTEARPTEVAVGDPVTLRIIIEDEAGSAPMDLLQAPPLQHIEAITSRFRIPSDPIGGRVDGDRKIFTQTLRARRDDVTEIPPVPLAYFDPDDGTYRIVRSEPIPLHVRAAATLSLDAVDAPQAAAADASATELTRASGAVLAVHVDPATALASQRAEVPRWFVLVLFIAPPLLFALVFAGRSWIARREDDSPARRRRLAARSARQRLNDAGNDPHANLAAAIAAALRGYAADRAGRAADALTADEAVAGLREDGASEEALALYRALLTRCDAAQYAGDPSTTDAEVLREARALITRLEQEQRR